MMQAIGYLQESVFTVRGKYEQRKRQIRLTLYTSMWGSLRLAPITTKVSYYMNMSLEDGGHDGVVRIFV